MGDFWTRVRASGAAAWQAAVIAAAASLLTFAFSRQTAFEDLRLWTFDFTVLHAGMSPPSKDVIFVDFDEETFNRIGKYPTPRGDVAKVIAAVGAQKPRVIGLDILLSEPRSAEEDKQMQDALTSAGVVIVAAQDGVGQLPPVIPMQMFCEPEDPKLASGFCVEGKPGALGYAYINMPNDSDGFVRYSLLLKAGKPPVASFPLTLAQQYTGQAFESVDKEHGRLAGKDIWYAEKDGIDYLTEIGSWGRSPLTHIPAWRFLTGEVDPHAVTDKLVVIGQSNDAARDKHFTPMFRQADRHSGERVHMGGTEVHGAAIRSLLEGTTVRPAKEGTIWTAVVLLAWLAAFFMLRLPTGTGVVGALALMVAPIFASFWLYAHSRYWLPFLPSQTGVAITLPLTLGWKFLRERIVAREARQQRRELMNLFSSYVDPAVANTIWQRRDEVSLAGEERVATVMFTDIRSFTSLSSGRPPADVLRWLNRYLTAMDEVIREHGGFLNKFIGDGLMIIFGLPLSRGIENDAERAVRAGVAMLRRVQTLNRQHAGNPEMPQLRIGIGIHTGPLMAGSIGSATRQEYSVIGETVNLASRLESQNKHFGTELLLSQATYDLLPKDMMSFRPLGEAKVPGLEEPVAVYTVDQAPE